MLPHFPFRALPGVIALLLLAALGAALAGCGSSSSENTSGSGEAVTSGARTGSGTTTSPPSQTTSKAPAGAAVKSCPGVRVAGASCAEGRATVTAWTGTRSCLPAESAASHSACTVGKYRCIATATDRGLAVNCARPGRSISFTTGKFEGSFYGE